MRKALLICFSIFIAINANAQLPAFKWANGIVGGGTLEDYPESIHTDASGNVYTMGEMHGVFDFDPGPGVVTLGHPNGDIYVTKSDSMGNFIWAKQLLLKKAGVINYAKYMTVDTKGNVYLAASLWDTADVDPGPGTFIIPSGGTFISKWNTSGDLVWAKQVNCGIGGIAADTAGNVYLSGFFSGTVDFDPGPGTYNMTGDTADMFILKLTTTGNFVWAKHTSGGLIGKGVGEGIAVDEVNSVYTTGIFYGTVDFDPGAATYNLTSLGPGTLVTGDPYILKLDSAGNFVYARACIGTGAAGNSKILVDKSHNVYMGTTFTGTLDFDPSSTSTYNLSGTGFRFASGLLKLDASGNFVWAKSMESSATTDDTYLEAIALDATGNVLIAGSFFGTTDFDPGAGTYNLSSSGQENLYILKLDASGNYMWALNLGGSTSGTGAAGDGMCLDLDGNIYATGTYSGSPDLDPGSGTHTVPTPGSGQEGIYVLKLGKGPAGVSEINNSNGITIYPNPANNRVTIRSGTVLSKATILVKNILGETVLEKQTQSGDQFIVDISDLSKGIYIVEIQEPDKVWRTKFVKAN